MITITNKLDMYPGGVPLVIHLSQYDSDFTLEFELFSSVGEFVIQSNTSAIFRGTKPDGNGYSLACDLTGNTVEVIGYNQLTAAAGRGEFEIALVRQGRVIYSGNLIIDVKRAAMDAGTITSESVLMELSAIIEGAETATQAAETASEAAETAVAAASQYTLKLNRPLDANDDPDNGTSGQLLKTNGDGSTAWVTLSFVDDGEGNITISLT